jgi:hypothetical protein
MRKPTDGAGRKRPSNRDAGVPDRAAAAVDVDGPAVGAPTAPLAEAAPYRIVWRCSSGPREVEPAGGESASADDEAR